LLLCSAGFVLLWRRPGEGAGARRLG
jgi:hypothetical protein